MKREDDQELWDLLGKGGQPVVSQFFAGNVLREIRQETTWRDRLAKWFQPRRLIPATAVALALLAAVLSFQKPAGSLPASADAPPDAIAQLDAEDYEVVADLDDLIALEEDNLWADADDISTL